MWKKSGVGKIPTISRSLKIITCARLAVVRATREIVMPKKSGVGKMPTISACSEAIRQAQAKALRELSWGDARSEAAPTQKHRGKRRRT